MGIVSGRERSHSNEHQSQIGDVLMIIHMHIREVASQVFSGILLTLCEVQKLVDKQRVSY